MIKYFLAALFFIPSLLPAQQHITDSLERSISFMAADSSKVNRLNDLAGKLQYTNPSKAAEKVQQSMALATSINYPLGLATAYRLRGVLYVDRSVLDSGKLYYEKAYDLVKDSKDKQFRKQAGLLTHNFGVIYHHRQKYDSAISNYLAAARIYKEIGEEGLYFFPYINLSTIYTFLQDNEKALFYSREVSTAAKKLNDPGKIVIAINQEMAVRLELKQYDSVLIPLRENVLRASALENHYGSGKGYNLIGKYFSGGKMQYDSAIVNRKKALGFMEKIDNQYEIAGLLEEIGYDYMQSGDYNNANDYLKRSATLAKSLGLEQVLKYALENLVVVSEKLGNINEAHSYLKEFVQVNDTLNSRNNRSQINELEARYQSENKELLIKNLQADQEVQEFSIRQKSTLNYILAGSAATILIISLLSYRSYRNKQKYQQQKIDRLEMEKQLTATESVLKGEERERTRLAQDLHDGLGGMLSGIKFSFNTMKKDLVMTSDNLQNFERSMDMLDSSIKEMRRVAHNMMPEALVKFGLDTALKDFCHDINESGALQINYQSIGLEDAEIEQSTAIAIYRIVQELVNNTLKHAAAKTAIVQVTKSENHLSVTVEDDGKGFEASLLKQSRGIGWINIQNRVELLKGRLDVRSMKDKGTSVLIELSI